MVISGLYLSMAVVMSCHLEEKPLELRQRMESDSDGVRGGKSYEGG